MKYNLGWQDFQEAKKRNKQESKKQLLCSILLFLFMFLLLISCATTIKNQQSKQADLNYCINNTLYPNVYTEKTSMDCFNNKGVITCIFKGGNCNNVKWIRSGF